MNARQIALSGALVAGGTVSPGQAAAAQHCDGPPAATAGAALERAEVVADTRIAMRARLTDYTTREEYDPASAEAQRRHARYTRLRFGPAYTDEVSRVQCPGGSVAATAQGVDAGAE